MQPVSRVVRGDVGACGSFVAWVWLTFGSGQSDAMADAMALCALQGCNKIPKCWKNLGDALHKTVVMLAWNMLMKWTVQVQLPIGAQQGLFKTYAMAWAHTSASCIWEEAWTLLSGPERGQLYKSVSEPFLEIVEDILNAVYAISCRGPLDSMN